MSDFTRDLAVDNFRQVVSANLNAASLFENAPRPPLTNRSADSNTPTAGYLDLATDFERLFGTGLRQPLLDARTNEGAAIGGNGQNLPLDNRNLLTSTANHSTGTDGTQPVALRSGGEQSSIADFVDSLISRWVGVPERTPDAPVRRNNPNGVTAESAGELLRGLLWNRFPMAARLRQGGIQLSDINELMLNGNLSRDEACMLAVLRENFQRIQTALHPNGGATGLTIADFERLDRMWRRGENPNLINRLANDFDFYRVQLGNASTNLYGTANPLDSITLSACQQPWHVGNCSFMSALGSLAVSNPQAIVDMIRDNGNGTYTVTFPGRDPITVNRPTDAQLAYYGLANPNGIWSAVMQSAFGRLQNPNAAIPLEGGASQSLNDCLRILTGREATSNSTGTFTYWSTMHNQIDQAVQNHRPVCAAINAEFFAAFGWSDNLEDATGLPCQHAYAIVGFTPNPQNYQEAQVTLWNPHGNVSWLNGQVPEGITDLGNGQFRMSLRRFNEIFSRIHSAR